MLLRTGRRPIIVAEFLEEMAVDHRAFCADYGFIFYHFVSDLKENFYGYQGQGGPVFANRSVDSEKRIVR